MNINRILVVGLLLSLFVGLASATEPTDVIDTVNDIDDTLTALEIANEGIKDYQGIKDDPTNTTRLKDGFKRPFNILFGGDIEDPEVVQRAMIGWIVIAFIGTIATIIIPLLSKLL